MDNYILMHKNILVADVNISASTGNINRVNAPLTPEHLPVGVHFKKEKDSKVSINKTELNDWWSDRCIPDARDGVDAIFNTLDIKKPKALITNAYGLSLSDGYWIKPQDSNTKWEDVNFFDNAFSSDIGDILFNNNKKKANFDLCSPDNTTDGCLKKRWQIINGKRCLIKGGNGAFNQQPFNEVIASKIMDRLDIPHIPYTIQWQDDYPYSVCETFINPDTELVSAWHVMQIKQKANHENYYTHYVNLCKEYGIKDIEHSLDQMIALDYIIANEDRHFNNFGIIRNTDTLEWVDAAPVFDSGTSLGYDKLPHRMNTDIKCKPFKSTHEKQLELIKSFDWIEFSKLNDIEDEISELMSNEKAQSILGDTRYIDISRFVKNRINNLEKFALHKQAFVKTAESQSKITQSETKSKETKEKSEITQNDILSQRLLKANTLISNIETPDNSGHSGLG